METDLLGMIARRWLLVAAAAIICGGVAVALTPLMPKKYDAHCTVFARSPAGALSSLSVQFPSAPVSLLAQGSSNADYLAAVLRSDKHARTVARQLQLARRPEFARKKGRPLSECEVTEALKKVVLVSDDRRGSLRITVIARSPALAARIANEYAAQLRGSVATASRRKRDFISAQLDSTERSLDQAAKELKDFQDASKTISLDEQTKAAISALADLQGQLMAARVEMGEVESGLRTGGSPAELAKRKSRKAALEARIAYLENAIGGYEATLARLPDVAMKLARLTRNVEVQQKIYQVLTEQYHLASIAEQSEDDMFEVVDPAVPAEKPRSPKRSVNLVTGLLFGLVIGIVAAVRAGVRSESQERKMPGRVGNEESFDL